MKKIFTIKLFIYLSVFILTPLTTTASADTAKGLANQALGIAGSIKSLVSSPPRINIDQYLSDKEMAFRYKHILEDFLDQYSTKNQNIRGLQFRQGKKFLFWQIKRRDTEAINLLHDMHKKVNEALEKYNINFSKYPRNIDGVLMSVQDCLNEINKKNEIFSLEYIENIFYKQIVNFDYDYEESEAFFKNAYSSYSEKESLLTSENNFLESLFRSLEATSASQGDNEIYNKIINSLVEIIIIIEYKDNLYTNKIKTIIGKIKNFQSITSELQAELLKTDELVNKNRKDIKYKYLFGEAIKSDGGLKNVYETINRTIF